MSYGKVQRPDMSAKKISKNLGEVPLELFVQHVNLRWRLELQDPQIFAVVQQLEGGGHSKASGVYPVRLLLL